MVQTTLAVNKPHPPFRDERTRRLHELLVKTFLDTSCAGLPENRFNGSDRAFLHPYGYVQTCAGVPHYLPTAKAIAEFPVSRLDGYRTRFNLVLGLTDDQLKALGIVANSSGLQQGLERYFTADARGRFGLRGVLFDDLADLARDFPELTTDPKAKFERLQLAQRAPQSDTFQQYPTGFAVKVRYLVHGAQGRFDVAFATRLAAAESMLEFNRALHQAGFSQLQQAQARALYLKKLSDRTTTIAGPDCIGPLMQQCIAEIRRPQPRTYNLAEHGLPRDSVLSTGGQLWTSTRSRSWVKSVGF